MVASVYQIALLIFESNLLLAWREANFDRMPASGLVGRVITKAVAAV